ncbi:MAG: aldo/keto reductase [Chloroflexi bacterium]|nr:MAG: aldo/keto reductase [Chloroflexota bacterium]
MQTRQFGNSDMQITPLGLGTWAIGGGGWAFGWGPQDDEASIATIHRAIDLGINWIDTAAVYGLGHSEEIVAKALKGRSDRPYVFTKGSRVWNDQGEITSSLKEQSLRREVENSLRRLQVDTIDLYQLHWPNPDPDIEEGWSTLAKLKSEGKLRYIGVSNFSVEQMERARKIAPITSLQAPYSLIFQEPRLTRNFKLASLLQDIGYPYNRTTAEVAIAWTLRHPAVTGAIVGGRRPEQVEEIIGAAEFRLSESELEQIEKFLQENP